MSKSSSTNSDLSDAGKKLAPTVGRHSDPCRICNKSVFILERLNVTGRILHRTCFKCARCGNQLSLAGYYETETGEYCCELCPDEESREEKQVTLRAGMRLEADEEADSGHSSEDSKDIEDEEDENKLEVTTEIEPKETTTVQVIEPTVEVTLDDKAMNLPGDLNANTELPIVLTAQDTLNNKSSNICSEVDIDVNDNTLGEVKEIILEANKLNISEENVTVEYPDDKNPFDDDDDDDDGDDKIDNDSQVESKADNATKLDNPALSADLVSEIKIDTPTEPTEIKTASLNPFGSDTESDHEEETKQKSTSLCVSEPKHTLESSLNKQSLNPFGGGFSSDEDHSQGSVSPSLSMRGQTRTRKKRRAPLPPGSLPSTPKSGVVSPFPVPSPRHSLASRQAGSSRSSLTSPSPGETAKRIKDENNMNRRSQILESIKNESLVVRAELPTIPGESGAAHLSEASHSETTSIAPSDTFSLMSSSTTTQSSGPSNAGSSQIFPPLSPDKAEEGQWRRKKGPAPPRPIPPKRTVKKLHKKIINQELEDIEVKQNEMERQGVKLEKTIREICDKNDQEGENRDSLGPEAEDLIIQLFDLVNEKNELFRRQTELIYMKKDNRLEEQHADLEYQIRILMSKPEEQKTAEDQIKEDRLIKKLVDVVGQRNEIVDCLEMDRLRELDEDLAIEDHMSNYAAVKPEEQKKGITKILRMKKKKKKKDKDNEKDIDTSEQPEGEVQVNSEKKKKSTKKKLLSYASKKLTFPH